MILRALNEFFFFNGFLKGSFENSVMFLKIKKISSQTIKCMNQNTKQNKRERNRKIGFILFYFIFYNREKLKWWE